MASAHAVNGADATPPTSGTAPMMSPETRQGSAATAQPQSQKAAKPKTMMRAMIAPFANDQVLHEHPSDGGHSIECRLWIDLRSIGILPQTVIGRPSAELRP